MPTYTSTYPEGYYDSATPTPSPRGQRYYYPPQTPQRPQTRADFHYRHTSASGFSTEFSPRPPTASPRYTSDGHYATANVSSNGHHSRKSSFSTPPRDKHVRRNSYAFVRNPTPSGESDEDEVIDFGNGGVFVLPAQSKARRRDSTSAPLHNVARHSYCDDVWRQGADPRYYSQGGYYQHYRDIGAYESPRFRTSTAAPPATSATPAPTHSRRSSMSTPQRPSTARPASSHVRKPATTASTSSATRATEADAKRHKIPAGYSLKNWDPNEAPILLLGSVFDANSLGKWIYDWTVYHHSPATPISDMAGDLWVLLIQLAGKLKRADECVGRVRNAEDRETIEEFIDSGERLNEKLRKLLKACETPMLKASKRKDSLGKNAGVEFVETLFGRDRELEKTEKFIQGLRTFNHRFDANCEEILRNPTR